MSKRRDHQSPLGAAIKAAREQKKLSVEMVAARAAVTERWLIEVEADESDPTWGHLRRLADAMEVPLPELMKRVEGMEEGEDRSGPSAKGPAKERRKRRRNRWNRPDRKGEVRPQEALAKALSHPLRAQALTIFGERTAGPKEIADELAEKLPNVSYHVRVLEELGLIELVEEETVRGSIAHFYKVVEQDVDSYPVWKWTPLLLDKDGWRRVIDIQRSAVETILEEQASAKRRMKGSHNNAVKAVLGLLFFEGGPQQKD